MPEQRVAFGTSGHRGSAFDKAFNEWHVLAISQAICLYREQKKIDGPLFLGMDTHALPVPADAGALEVLAANGVEVMIAQRDEYTPTPAVYHAIITYNRGRTAGLADGVLGSAPVRQEMKRVRSLAGASGGYVYSATVSATRPPADYTARVIPHDDGVAIPLEDARILWRR